MIMCMGFEPAAADGADGAKLNDSNNFTCGLFCIEFVLVVKAICLDGIFIQFYVGRNVDVILNLFTYACHSSCFYNESRHYK